MFQFKVPDDSAWQIFQSICSDVSEENKSTLKGVFTLFLFEGYWKMWTLDYGLKLYTEIFMSPEHANSMLSSYAQLIQQLEFSVSGGG